MSGIVNRLLNPSFETDTLDGSATGWTSSGTLGGTSRVSADWAAHGYQSLHVVRNASTRSGENGGVQMVSTDGVVVDPDDVVVIRCTINVTRAIAGTFRMRARFFDSSGANASFGTEVTIDGSAGVREFPCAYYIVPSGRALATIDVWGQTVGAGETIDFYLDACLLVVNPQEASDWVWSGDAELDQADEWPAFYAQDSARITQVSSPRGQGAHAYRIDLRDGDVATENAAGGTGQGERAELSTFPLPYSVATPARNMVEGDERWIAWQFYLPSGEFDLAPRSWKVIRQLKHLASGTGVAPLVISVSDGKFQIWGSNSNDEGELFATKLWEQAAVTDRWIRVVEFVRAHTDAAQGRYMVWTDLSRAGMLEQELDVTRHTMAIHGIVAASLLYHRIGIYRDSSNTGDETIYYDGYNVARTREIAEWVAFRRPINIGTGALTEPPFFVGTLSIPEPFVAEAMTVRERPPLWLTTRVVPPGSARSYRWAGDEPAAANRVSGQTISSSVPGGFESMSATLPRLLGIEYGDLSRLSDVWVYGAGGEVRWEGRLTDAPAVSGGQMAVTPNAVGHKEHLQDDQTVSEIFIDRDLSRWTGPGAQRRLDLIRANIPHQGDASQAWDTGANAPALTLAVQGAWADPTIPRCEAWYDAGSGNRIAGVPGSFAGDPSTAFELFVVVDEDAVSSATENSGDVYTAASGSFDFRPSSRRRYAHLRWSYNSTPAGADGGSYAVSVRFLRVLGDHGLTLRTGPDGFDGYCASDILAYAVPKWAPRLRVTSESIEETSYVISQLAIYEAGNLQALIDDVTKYGLEDYAVWDDRTFWLYQRGTVGKSWVARVGPSKLRQAGPSSERLWNAVTVRYRDVDGATRTVGPPGSGCDFEDVSLRDDDPENEANKLGITRMAPPLDMGGVSVPGAALIVGGRFLEEARQLDQSGNAELVGTVFDDRGIEHPASAVRGGDTIRFVDARDPSPRRIVRASYSTDTLTATVDLDAPPEGMDAVLARLGLAVQGVG